MTTTQNSSDDDSDDALVFCSSGSVDNKLGRNHNVFTKNKMSIQHNLQQIIRRTSALLSRDSSVPERYQEYSSTNMSLQPTNSGTHMSRSSSIKSRSSRKSNTGSEYDGDLMSSNNGSGSPHEAVFIKTARRGSYSGPLKHSYSFDNELDFNFNGSNISLQKLSTDGDDLDMQNALCRVKQGLYMFKVSRKKTVKYMFSLINDQLIHWNGKYIDIDTIKDIRIMENANNYREQLRVSPEVGKYWITIIYQVPKNKLKALHAYCSTLDILETFYFTVYNIAKQRHEMMKKLALPNSEDFANFHWNNSTDMDQCTNLSDADSLKLNFEKVANICSKFNILCAASYLRNIYIMADLDGDNLLTRVEFQRFVRILKTRPEISKIVGENCLQKSHFDFHDFSEFVKNIQKENYSENKLKKTFKKYSNDEVNGVTTDGFLKYLSNQTYLNQVTSPRYYDRPLNHYFISSSHNTYLRGNQVGESSTVESYIEVLQKGCRCVEVDVWDGENGPVICHGILSGSISLKSVLEVIRKYAFITSPYPLIVSFEVHCKDENQLIMIYLINEYLKDMLAPKFEQKLTSPSELKNKILLKFTKRGKIYGTENHVSSTTSIDSSEDEEAPEFKNSNLKNTFNITRKNKVPILPQLLELSHIQGIRFKNFSLSESKNPTHSFSFSEKKFKDVSSGVVQKYALDKHNRRFLMRIYPHALRYKSTNFDPIQFWKLGAQMVATNWQTHDIGQKLNFAMFSAPMQKSCHWSSGYVLKPKYLIPKVKIKEMANYYKNLKLEILKIKIEVISAQWLHRPEEMKNDGLEVPINVFADIEFFSDIKSVKPMKTRNGVLLSDTRVATKVVRGNGVSPVWNTTVEIELYNTELNFINIDIKTNDSVGLGTCCFKLNDLKKGYRHLPLYDCKTGEKYIFSTLFLKICY